ncbi:MAG: glycine cleavage system protein GcvH [Candidatus Krumholzibacteria bacterium]|nr:glycine cleavage system protein GcvH [Candidatus Krumholzibacteria bacterium]
MMVPEESKFTKDHEWVFVEDEIATIGISDYATGELGDIVYVELPEVDTEVQQLDPIGTIEAVKTVAELFSPVSGTIVEINDAIMEDPETVNSSPFGDGWFIKIRMDDPGELDALFSYTEYQEFLGEQAE